MGGRRAQAGKKRGWKDRLEDQTRAQRQGDKIG